MMWYQNDFYDDDDDRFIYDIDQINTSADLLIRMYIIFHLWR